MSYKTYEDAARRYCAHHGQDPDEKIVLLTADGGHTIERDRRWVMVAKQLADLSFKMRLLKSAESAGIKPEPSKWYDSGHCIAHTRRDCTVCR